MLGIRFFKANPTTYVLHFRNGRVVREGPGLSFYYYAPNSTIVAVPISSVDVPFVFNETSADFQTVTVQGQLSYRVAEPRRLASLLDFSVLPSGRYASGDPERLAERLVNLAQVHTSAVTHRMTLREALVGHEAIRLEVLEGMRGSELVQMLGLEMLGLSILAISPTPEMAKALEAEAREAIQMRSDEAVYARRNAGVEQERRIKESELNTEIAVEEKRRIKRETQMNADIAIEGQRRQLIDSRVENERKQADAHAYGVEALLRAVGNVDWRVLTALSAVKMQPAQQIAMAFREMAENAGKIGNLTITPDLLETIAARKPAE